MQIILDNAGFIAEGVGVTIALTLFGFAGAFLIGTIIAIFRVSPIAPLRWFGTVYVEFLRNIPVLALLVLVAFGLPQVGILLPLFWAAAVALVLSSSAFVCETVRSGINTVAVGQSEAARALGMGFTQILTVIILPQALRAMIQPLVNVFIGTLIGSSLAAAVGVADLTNVTQQLNVRYAEAVLTFLVAGLIYLALALLMAWGGSILERRLGAGTSARRRPGPAGPAQGIGVEAEVPR